MRGESASNTHGAEHEPTFVARAAGHVYVMCACHVAGATRHLLVRLDHLKAAVGGDSRGEDTHDDADARLGQPVDLVMLEDVAEDEGAREGHQTDHEAEFDGSLLLLLVFLFLGDLLGLMFRLRRRRRLFFGRAAPCAVAGGAANATLPGGATHTITARRVRILFEEPRKLLDGLLRIEGRRGGARKERKQREELAAH